jgi:hypothetical protein
MTGAYTGRKLKTLCASGLSREVRATSLQQRTATLLALLAALGLIAVGSVGCAGAGSGGQGDPPASKSTTASTAPTSLRVNPASDGLFCPTQVAWSPDSTRIAVLGNAVNCSGSATGRTPGLILVFAAASGEVVQRLQPDSTVLTLPTITQQVAANSAGGGLISTLTYQSLSWTPDSEALLMVFDLELVPNANLNGCCTSIYGLQRLGVTDSTLSRIWIDTSGSQFARFERWNLVSGIADVPPALATATGYQWNADGTLATADPGGLPVGTPDGGQTFTAWQSGQLGFATKSDKATGSTTVIPEDVGWLSNISPISPDGHYFYPNMLVAGTLAPPSTQLLGGPVLSPHDQALTALARQMMQTPSPNQDTTTLVAWRPDGSYLAELAPDATNPNPAAFTTSIYGTANDKLAEELRPNLTGLSRNSSGTMALLWSPDGSRLLLLDNIAGVLNIWGPSALPV